MLNYVWIALIIFGIGTALWIDSADSISNKYNNNSSIKVKLDFKETFVKGSVRTYNGNIIAEPSEFNKHYSETQSAPINQPAKLTFSKNSNTGSLYIDAGSDTPQIWKEMAKVNGKENDLTGTVTINKVLSDSTASAEIKFETISFVKMKEVTSAVLSYASTAVEIAIGLIGIMALWLGIMKIADEAGIIKIIANALKPITKFLFPDVPSDHPAMGAMIMNISANMLGLSNAATPFGLKAMEELDKLNPNKGTATNAMVTFLAVNTAGLTLIPATAIAVRAASGSDNPAIIIGTSIFGAGCATIVGVTAAKLFEKFPLKFGNFSNWLSAHLKSVIVFFSFLLLAAIFFVSGIGKWVGSLFKYFDLAMLKDIIQIISILAIPLIILVFILYSAIKKVKVYEKFVEGAKEGFNVAIRIIPYLVGMLVAIGIFRAGGAMDFLILLLRPITDFIGMPAEALPMALMRPLSGSGSLGLMTEIIKTHGADSFLGILVSTFYGSTETTFYVLAVYFGSVNIVKTRHAVPVGLLADIAGMLAALFIVSQLFG